METISSVENLKEKIQALEIRLVTEETALREQFREVHRSLKPSHLLVSAIKDLSSSTELKGSLMDAAMGMTAGFLSKKVVTGNSKNPVKHILGNILEVVVAAGVAKNSDAIKSAVTGLVQKFFSKGDGAHEGDGAEDTHTTQEIQTL